MKNNRIKQITIVCVLILVAIGIGYNVYEKTLVPAEQDTIADENIKKEVKPQDIEDDKPTVEVAGIKEDEPVQKEKEQEVPTEVEKPVVPPAPELPKQENVEEHPVEEKDKLPDGEHEVQEGDTEINPEPPVREESPTVEPQEPVENPVVVTPDAPTDTEGDNGSNLVPDSENPFAKPPTKRPDSGLEGGSEGSDYGDGEWGTGDKF